MNAIKMQDYGRFQSTPSAWRETLPASSLSVCIKISIHSLRMEGDFTLRIRQIGFYISIHSLRMEGDPAGTHQRRFVRYFNPLPPHGGRHCRRRRCPCASRFQSTPSAWRETSHSESDRSDFTFQSTPSAWRETLLVHINGVLFVISIHSLRMEGDETYKHIPDNFHHFNPLPPHGGRHNQTYSKILADYISIHSLRMEGDRQSE